jgi:hypothetical protein
MTIPTSNKSYLGLRAMKSGPGWLDGNMEREEQDGTKNVVDVEWKWSKNSKHRWNLNLIEEPTMQTSKVISQATSNEIEPTIAQWKYETEEKNPKDINHRKKPEIPRNFRGTKDNANGQSQ